ncbi:carboxymuconolactone decarboxylase family protein [Antarctobacter sp.]|uniref:carboxymuconolactone decarboxylase family protein n=1 Tax=Antarctobacter sp. TaxID=1872577 RepID=UPI002B27305D|nr:carboxymuconolactone decarboxylase family protein [Antarctobacter sp.]
MTPRIPLPGPDEMNTAQKAVYDKIISGPRGTLVGPLRAALHNPSLADRWQAMGQVLRYETSLPRDLNELAILVVGRHWNSELEWTIHAGAAREAGLDEQVIEAVRLCELPDFTREEEREVYDFSRELLEHGQVSDATYGAMLNRWGSLGVVELTALVGYYSMVAMTLNAHGIPLPDHIPAELNSAPPSRTALPESPLRDAAE